MGASTVCVKVREVACPQGGYGERDEPAVEVVRMRVVDVLDPRVAWVWVFECQDIAAVGHFSQAVVSNNTFATSDSTKSRTTLT